MLDVFHQHFQLRLERRRVAWKLGDLDEKVLDLRVLLEALADDLFQFFIALIKQMRIEDRLLDMSVDIELALDLFEGRGIVAILIFLDPCEEVLDLSMVGL